MFDIKFKRGSSLRRACLDVVEAVGAKRKTRKRPGGPPAAGRARVWAASAFQVGQDATGTFARTFTDVWHCRRFTTCDSMTDSRPGIPLGMDRVTEAPDARPRHVYTHARTYTHTSTRAAVSSFASWTRCRSASSRLKGGQLTGQVYLLTKFKPASPLGQKRSCRRTSALESDDLVSAPPPPQLPSPSSARSLFLTEPVISVI